LIFNLCDTTLMHPLIGLHATAGEFGALAFLWVAVELLNPTESRIRRATWIAGIGVILLFISWIAGGYYYLTDYQSIVKPVIKAGPLPWSHSVITETKEHIFLMIPFLALVSWSLVRSYGTTLIADRGARMSAVLISALVVIFAFAMAGMGFIISSGFRGALEATVL